MTQNIETKITFTPLVYKTTCFNNKSNPVLEKKKKINKKVPNQIDAISSRF